jgi:hypothetical protein
MSTGVASVCGWLRTGGGLSSPSTRVYWLLRMLLPVVAIHTSFISIAYTYQRYKQTADSETHPKTLLMQSALTNRAGWSARPGGGHNRHHAAAAPAAVPIPLAAAAMAPRRPSHHVQRRNASAAAANQPQPPQQPPMPWWPPVADMKAASARAAPGDRGVGLTSGGGAVTRTQLKALHALHRQPVGFERCVIGLAWARGP